MSQHKPANLALNPAAAAGTHLSTGRRVVDDADRLTSPRESNKVCTVSLLTSADAAVVAAARAGDRTARERLLRELQDPWYRMCLGLLGDAEKARDAVQETALRFLRQLPGFRGDSQLRTWSLGIALNVAREMRRRRGREMSVAGPVESAEPDAIGTLMRPGSATPAAAPDAAAEAVEQLEQLRATLEGLPDRQKEAIVLRFFEELSVEETAAAMGCAAGTVKATVHQALRSLRQKLSHWE